MDRWSLATAVLAAGEEMGLGLRDLLGVCSQPVKGSVVLGGTQALTSAGLVLA